jgi:outer membrane immunogenic protein
MIAGSQARQLGCGKVMKGRQMRWVCVLVVLLGFAPQAFAADLDSDSDLDVLRGSEPVGPPSYTNWSGFYFGGQGTYASGGANFAQATGPLISFLLRNTVVEQTFSPSSWTVLGKGNSTTTGFGGFVGYNSQWSNLILGIEASYTDAQWSASSTDSLARRMDSAGTTYNVSVDGTSSIKLKDYGSLRGRFGYIMGDFMPYGFLGFVVGRADITKTATVSDIEVSDSTGAITGCLGGVLPSCSLTDTDNRTNQYIYGYSGGVGLDYAVTHNFFLRGEYEYIQFVNLGGLQLYLNNLRVGAGYKF